MRHPDAVGAHPPTQFMIFEQSKNRSRQGFGRTLYREAGLASGKVIENVRDTHKSAEFIAFLLGAEVD